MPSPELFSKIKPQALYVLNLQLNGWPNIFALVAASLPHRFSLLCATTTVGINHHSKSTTQYANERFNTHRWVVETTSCANVLPPMNSALHFEPGHTPAAWLEVLVPVMEWIRISEQAMAREGTSSSTVFPYFQLSTWQTARETAKYSCLSKWIQCSCQEKSPHPCPSTIQ